MGRRRDQGREEAASNATLAKSRTKDSIKAFDKLTHVVDGERRIISDPPLIVPVDELLGPRRGPRVPRRDPRRHPLLPSQPARRIAGC